MSSKKIKRRDKLARLALDGKITVQEAQRRAGGKYARKAAQEDLAKLQRAQAARRDQSAQLAGMVKEAVAGVLKSAQPVTRPGPAAVPAGTAVVPPGTERWTGAQRELLRKSQFHDSPFEREAARQALVNEGVLPGTRPGPAARTTRAMVRVPGPDGSFTWRPVPEPAPANPGYAPRGTAGR